MTSRDAILLLLLLATVLETGCAAAAPSTVPAAPTLPTSATAANGTSIVAISPPAQPCCPKQTLPQFLGINGLFKGIGGLLNRLRNRLGSRFPGLEAKPELLSITDPANLSSPNPAVAEAAKVKADEDGAAQKIKAIRYLASIGCTVCYPDVEPALLAALDDCTEAVRYEAVVGLRAAAGNPCKTCRTKSCCSPKIIAKLDKMANQTDSNGCNYESSERVRRVARLALGACGNTTAPNPAVSPLPLEGPSGELLPPAGPAPLQPTPISAPTNDSAATPGQHSVVVPARIRLTSSDAEIAAPEQAAPSFNQILSHYSTSREMSQPEYEVRWERIAAPLDHFRTREDAVAVMTLVRTQALGAAASLPPGVPVQAIVTQGFPWTRPAAAGSPTLAHLLSVMPVGGISQAFEDGRTVQMIRVLERREVAPVQQVSATVEQPAAVVASAAAPVVASAPRVIVIQQAAAGQPNCQCNQ
jgi:hypothetical protein